MYTIDLNYYNSKYSAGDRFDDLLRDLRRMTGANEHIEARIALAVWLDGWFGREEPEAYNGCYMGFARALTEVGNLYYRFMQPVRELVYQLERELLNMLYSDTNGDGIYYAIAKAL